MDGWGRDGWSGYQGCMVWVLGMNGLGTRDGWTGY